MTLRETGLIPCLSADRIFAVYAGPCESAPGFPADCWTLVCPLDGAGPVTSGSGDDRCCRPGELFLAAPSDIPPEFEGNGQILAVCFAGEGLVGSLPEGVTELSPMERELAALLTRAAACCTKDKASVISAGPEDLQIVRNLLEALLLSLRKRNPTRVQDRFFEIVGYMREHVDESLCSGDICEGCGIGRSALKELFRRHTGAGVMKYFAGMRIRRAALLMERGKSIADVAAEMNFSSQNYFSTYFKRETGVTPSGWRAEHLAAPDPETAETEETE